MFRVLIESGARQAGVSQGSLVSVAMHAAMIALALFGSSTGTQKFDVPEEGVRKDVVFMMPMDRYKAPPPQEHSLRWNAPGDKAGNEGVEQKPVDRAAVVEASVVGRGPEEGTPEQVTEETPPPADAIFDSVATVLDVDSAVTRHAESAAPVYPAELLARKIEGGAFVQFIVDTTGFADTTSFRVVSATHAEFAQAVRRALPDMRFSPAIMHSKKVRQLVEQPFMFRIVVPTAQTVSDSKPRNTIP